MPCTYTVEQINSSTKLVLLFCTDLEHKDPCDYRVGDKVQINLSTSELRVLQSSSSCGWQDQMASVRFRQMRNSLNHDLF